MLFSNVSNELYDRLVQILASNWLILFSISVSFLFCNDIVFILIYMENCYLDEVTNCCFVIFRWDSAWQRSTKQQQTEQTNLFNSQPGTTFNIQFPPPVSRQRRSNSLTPPVAPSHHFEVLERSNNSQNSSRHKTRSFSISGDHTSTSIFKRAITYKTNSCFKLHILNCKFVFIYFVGGLIGLGPLSPQSSCASSGSEGRLDEASTRSLESGMRGKNKSKKISKLPEMLFEKNDA